MSMATEHHRAAITVGDKTSKGGTVLEGSPVSSIAGRPLARLGDRVSCPCNACKGRGGVAVISTASNSWLCDGKRVARDGDFIECGGVLMAAGDVAHATCAPMAAAVTLAASMFGAKIATAHAAKGSTPGSATNSQGQPRFDETVQLATQDDVLAGLPYFVAIPGKDAFFGRVDESGKLPRIETDSAEDYTVFWGDEALAKQAGEQLP